MISDDSDAKMREISMFKIPSGVIKHGWQIPPGSGDFMRFLAGKIIYNTLYINLFLWGIFWQAMFDYLQGSQIPFFF